MNFVIYLFPIIIKVLLNFVLIIPISTYYLEVEDFGVFAIITMISGLLMPLTTSGGNWVLSNYYYELEEKDRKILTFNIILIELLSKIFVCFCFWILSKLFLHLIVSNFKSEYYNYFNISLLSVFFSYMWVIVSYLFILGKKSKTYLFVEVSHTLINFVVLILCLILNFKVKSLFLAPLFSNFFLFIVCIFFLKKLMFIKFDKEWIKVIFKKGTIAIPFNFFELISNSVDRYLIQKWIDLKVLGIYSHSLVYRRLFGMGLKAFGQSFIPDILKAFNDNDDCLIKNIYKRWYYLLGFLGVFSVFFSEYIIDFISHGKFNGAANIVPFWIVLIISQSFGIYYSKYLLYVKKNKLLVKSGILTGTLFIFISIFFVKYFGCMGAAFAVVMSNITLNIVRRRYAILNGCKLFLEGTILKVTLIIVMMYVLNLIFTLPIMLKIAIFLTLLILHREVIFDIYKTIKDIFYNKFKLKT